MQDAFIRYWAEVAKHFGTNPNVIGLDPLNEPFPSNIWKDIMLILDTEKMDRDILTPLYRRIWEEAWSPVADSQKIMMF